jgi:hypothetical protein
LTANAGNSRVVLSWSSANGATGYQVKSSTTNGGPYAIIATPATTGYTNSGLANGTTYYYVVSATAGIDESSNSIQVTAIPTAATTNVALFKPVTVSSTQSGYPGNNAVDGNTTTRWGSAWSDPQWIYVDLLATYNITRVKLNWEAAYGTAFQIQVSPDASNWTAIYSTSTGSGGIQDLNGLSGTGRYVRMYGTARATSYGYSLWEFEIYGILPAPTNHPPVLAAISNQVVLAGRTLLVTNTATDVDVPAQTLTFSLLDAPLNAAINSSNGLFSWRPAMAQSPSMQTIAVVVSDNGAPILSATQNFSVTVNQPASPTLVSTSITNGEFGFLINGDTGPDYVILVSTNLTSWDPTFTGNSLPVPYYWVDTNSPAYPTRYYHVVLGP